MRTQLRRSNLWSFFSWLLIGGLILSQFFTFFPFQSLSLAQASELHLEWLGNASSASPSGQAESVQPRPLADVANLQLTKSIDGDITTANVGDTIFYRIRFQCSSLTTDCGQMEITDVLPTHPDDGSPIFTYVPADSSVPAGYTMTESPAGTIVITKDVNGNGSHDYPQDNFLDGSQADAVIAVRVNYDARPLPFDVVNTAVGRVKPPGEDWLAPVNADSPSINIEEVNTVDGWELTKSLYSPQIEPTVDTDVTYRLRLCPTQTTGNIALSNIILTDTLPAGAEFRNATGSYVHTPDPGGDTVVWNITGPVTPPTCVTRYITVRYNSADGFSVGDPNITNTAEMTGEFVDNDGEVCDPSCYGSGPVDEIHNIIDIVEEPTWSKSDTGDPVGISGTARFVLGLNTNATNYPSNEIIMVDYLPPELKVMQITSGAWTQNLDGDPLFDIVRATLYISTYDSPDLDTPSDWWLLGSVNYNDNNLYDSLFANITAVRWDFEHDFDRDGSWEDGLPYEWSFSSNPQIRVTPRDMEIDTTDGIELASASPGATYQNCLHVRRRDSDGVIQMGGCQPEEMTVEGDFVSLRTTKSETPGTGYDPVVDPNIENFSSDGKILPNDTLRYVINVAVTERSSIDLVAPVIEDTLPDELIFVRTGDVQLDGSDIDESNWTFTASESAGDPGGTLRWEFDDDYTVLHKQYGSSTLTLEFFARVPPGTDPLTYTNTIYTVTDSADVVCEVGTELEDPDDVDGDGDVTEPACQNTDNYEVERSAALRGEKWIRSIDATNNEVLLVEESGGTRTFTVDEDFTQPTGICPDGGDIGLSSVTSGNHFTRYPCVSQAFPDGAFPNGTHTGIPTAGQYDEFEYNLRIFNEGNVPMLRYILYDILPYWGDTGSGGILQNESRESEFRPVMTGPIEFIQGSGLSATDFEILYNTSNNPCRPEVFDEYSNPTVPSGCDNAWLTEAEVTDWSIIRSYKIRLRDELVSEPSIASAVDPGDELRFGVPLSIPQDAPPEGFTQDDAQTREIAWNSFAHVGAYDKNSDPNIDEIIDLLASEPRKVGITIPERLSIGNRVWRDSDNSGTINAADDTDPGIPNVVVNLYDADNSNALVATTTTDAGGYYLFSNLPEGNYVVGIPASNFGSGAVLEGLRSSTGAGAYPTAVDYTNPPDSTDDIEDHGIDPASPGDEVFSATINLTLNDEPRGETDLSDNDDHGLEGARRGHNAETDISSDLTVDFGFFGGTDVPFSIGNHVWYDNGTGGNINNGIFDADESPVVGARVELYRDGNLNGTPEDSELIRFDVTDAEGFYLFDNLDPGEYYVKVSAGNFGDADFDANGDGTSTTAVLKGWYSSQGHINVEDDPVAAVDQDDNGIDVNYPEDTGVWSSVIRLARGTDEPTGEDVSNDTNNADKSHNPTAGDGPNGLGRFGETDESSNLTVDFGFIPPMSLGNRVWFDSGSTAAGLIDQFNDGIMNGNEVGVSGVLVELYKEGETDPLDSTTTDSNGYYLFERLEPGDYVVKIVASNFESGGALENYISSTGNQDADLDEDLRDDGIDDTDYLTNGIVSDTVTLVYNDEPENDDDLGPDAHGTYGQEDKDSNLSVDFGFVAPPRSLGNQLWFDDGTGGGTINDGRKSGGEAAVVGADVSLYLDQDDDGEPDGAAIRTDITDANGYYLFDNLPPARYLVGVDALNFQSTKVLDGYTSSTGHVDNDTSNNDRHDNGIDRVEPGNATASPYGILSTPIDLTANPPHHITDC